MDPSTDKKRPVMTRLVQVLVTFATAFLLMAHVLKWNAVRVDSIALALLGLLLVIPLAELIRKVKVGDFEAEIGKAEVASVEAKASVELAPAKESPYSAGEERVLELADEDPRLALAKVRIDLEESVNRLYAATSKGGTDPKRLSLGRVVESLVKDQILAAPVGIALREVISLANRAVHGEHVEQPAATELALLGIRLAREIQETYLEKTLKPVESVVIPQPELLAFENAKYRVTTVVPLVDKPKKNTYLLDQEGLESFLEGYEEYAEFIVKIERVAEAKPQSAPAA